MNCKRTALVALMIVSVSGVAPAAVKRPVKPVAKRVAPKPAPKLTRTIVLKAGDLTGVVKSTRGKPLDNVSIQLYDNAGKPVASTKTNVKGEYAFKGVDPGQYVAVVDGRTRLRITMTNAGKVSRLLIIPPAPAAAPAAAAAGTGLTTWQWVAIGAGSAVVVGGGIALLAGGGGGSSGSSGPISP